MRDCQTPAQGLQGKGGVGVAASKWGKGGVSPSNNEARQGKDDKARPERARARVTRPEMETATRP